MKNFKRINLAPTQPSRPVTPEEMKNKRRIERAPLVWAMLPDRFIENHHTRQLCRMYIVNPFDSNRRRIRLVVLATGNVFELTQWEAANTVHGVGF